MSGKAKTAPVAQDPTVVATNNATEQVLGAVGYHNIIKKLLADGVKRINSLQIKNVNYSEQDNYTRISLTLTTPVKCYVTDDEGETYRLGTTQTIYTSLYAIVGAIKEDEDLAWMGNALLENPKALNLILNGSKIDILQQEFAANEEIVNPFSTNADAEARTYDHATIINNIVQFKLGKTGEKMAEKLADKLMGF